MGVDATKVVIKNPLKGSIDYSDFSLNAENINIEQWFETTPVGEENTFIISTELNLDLVTSEFFENFATFVRNYVYPTLRAFYVKMEIKGSLTFLPYNRQHIEYNAFSNLVEYNYYVVDGEIYNVKDNEDDVPFLVSQI